MTLSRTVGIVLCGINLTFAALNVYMFVAQGHWYSAATAPVSLGAVGIAAWLARRR